MTVLRYHTGSGQVEVGEEHPLPVALGGTEDNPGVVSVPLPASFVHGQTVVNSAGTALPLAGVPTPLATGVTVKALHDNSGDIYVGGDAVDSGNGYVLAPGDAALILTDDLSSVYVDAAEGGDAVCWLAS